MLKKLPVMVVVLIALTLFKGQARAVEFKSVRLIVDGASSTILTSKTTVGEFLEEQGIVLQDKDKININPESKILEGRPIEVELGFNLEINIDGKPENRRIAPGTKVGNLVAEIKRETGNEYLHDYSPAEVITPESTIKLYSMVQKTVTETELIEYEIEILYTDELYEGENEVLTEGQTGVREITYMVITKFNTEVSRLVTDTVVTKEPVKQVVRLGTKSPEEDLFKPPASFLNKITMDSTGYSADYECTGKYPGHPYYGITATGIPAAYGVVAVDPNVIPLGSKLFVEGYGNAIAADTGSAIRGNKIDLYFDSLNEAREYGHKTLNVYVIETTQE